MKIKKLTSHSFVAYAIIFMMTLMHTHFSRAQSNFSISAGIDFASLQLITEGRIAHVYDDNGIEAGFALPVSVTTSYTYKPFSSNIAKDLEIEKLNFNLMLSVAGAAYADYTKDDLRLNIALGYGVFVNSEPFDYDINFETGDREYSASDYMNFNLYFNVGARYQRFGVKFTTMSDMLQVFGTYDLSDAFFVGIGYRRLNRIILLSDEIPDGKPSGLQATIGVKFGKNK